MAQTTRIKERQAAQAQRIKQAQAFMVPDNIDVVLLVAARQGSALPSLLLRLLVQISALSSLKCIGERQDYPGNRRRRCNFANADLSFENFPHPKFVQGCLQRQGHVSCGHPIFFLGSAVLRKQLKTRVNVPAYQASEAHPVTAAQTPKKLVSTGPGTRSNIGKSAAQWLHRYLSRMLLLARKPTRSTHHRCSSHRRAHNHKTCREP